jgi:regulatory protein
MNDQSGPADSNPALDAERTPRKGRKDRKDRPHRGPRKVTPEYLKNSALHYLERFATSSENLRQVLMRKVYRSVQHHDTDPEEGAAMVDALIARFQNTGLLNDTAYAEMRAASLNRSGGSKRMIRAKLAQKGVDAGTIDGALDTLAEEVQTEPDEAAAWALARKRRLGPYRPPEDRPERRERDLAAMARAGFDFDLVLAVIDAERTPEECA